MHLDAHKDIEAALTKNSRLGQIPRAVCRTSPSRVARGQTGCQLGIFARQKLQTSQLLGIEKTDTMMRTLHTGGLPLSQGRPTLQHLLLQLHFLDPLRASFKKSTRRVMRQSNSPACEQGTDLVRNTIFQNFQNTVRMPAVTSRSAATDSSSD